MCPQPLAAMYNYLDVMLQYTNAYIDFYMILIVKIAFLKYPF